MRRLAPLLALAASSLAISAASAEATPCEPKSSCFGLESAAAAISTHQAGAHPDLTLSFALAQDPGSEANAYGLHEPYAPMRDVRIELPPGFVGDPNVIGASSQCTVQELVTQEPVLLKSEEDGCPNASQVGVTTLKLFAFPISFTEPVYMMQPPGGDVVARLGMIAGIYPTFIDFRLRSGSDYGLTTEIANTSPNQGFVAADVTTWGVPASPLHDTERCTPKEIWPSACTESPKRPPGSRLLPFLTNPTSCAQAPELRIAADSWFDPGAFDEKDLALPPITGCDKLPFNPSLSVEPTSHRAGAPTGLELSFRLPGAQGTEVLESSQLKDIRIDFPEGMGINTASADGLGTCSPQQVGFGNSEASHCPDDSKLGDTEFEVAALSRRMKGSIYLREPEPGHLFRIWVVADDLGAHIKLPGELEVDEATGQIHSVVFDVPQFPTREVRLLLKSGFRAPLVNPASCGTYQTHWLFTPWSGNTALGGDTPMHVTEGCDQGGFDPQLSAGSTNPAAGTHAPFLFALTRQDGEQNPASLDVTLPKGFAASFAGIARCEGQQAETGRCPASSQVGRVLAATGAGPNPLWVPQPGKDPTAVYLGGPYKGAPLSVVAVVPAQAGPFDLGDQVVRSPIFVDPTTAQATASSDPLPQFIQGIPILYRTIEVALDRPGFALNPTSCAQKQTQATVPSTQGQVAHPTSPFWATGCPQLSFSPKISFRLFGATHRGAHPRLRASVQMPPGGANLAAAQVALPHSEFLDQGHIKTICTRVQFAAHSCPPGSIYGHATARSPLFDFPLEGDAILRSSDHPLPDLVLALKGPAQMPLEVDVAGRIDSIKGGIRTSFDQIPDAPVSSFTLNMAGGAKGLLQNSTDLCASTNRATTKFAGQNGKAKTLHPPVKASCKRGAGRRR